MPKGVEVERVGNERLHARCGVGDLGWHAAAEEVFSCPEWLTYPRSSSVGHTGRNSGNYISKKIGILSVNILPDHTGMFATGLDILPNHTGVFGTHFGTAWCNDANQKSPASGCTIQNPVLKNRSSNTVRKYPRPPKSARATPSRLQLRKRGSALNFSPNISPISVLVPSLLVSSVSHHDIDQMEQDVLVDFDM